MGGIRARAIGTGAYLPAKIVTHGELAARIDTLVAEAAHFVALRQGSIVALDELDNDIHPLVLPEIVRLFQEERTNPNGAQLIMSCQNATLLDHLAKEEVFVTEKDSEGRTAIYGLQDVQGVRRDENLYAHYLMGVYGAVPRLG